MAELEGLLAAQRAREYRSELDGARSGGQLGAVQQRNRVLEEQVETPRHPRSDGPRASFGFNTYCTILSLSIHNTITRTHIMPST